MLLPRLVLQHQRRADRRTLTKKRTAQTSTADELGLKQPPRVESYRGFYFVNFNPYAEDLVTYLAGAREYLDLIMDQSEEGMRMVAGSNKYTMKANWKLLVENSLDGYHLVPDAPDLPGLHQRPGLRRQRTDGGIPHRGQGDGPWAMATA